MEHHCNKHGFTLAEILITLGIIGVVAALTMPALIQNYTNNVAETRLKNKTEKVLFYYESSNFTIYC